MDSTTICIGGVIAIRRQLCCEISFWMIDWRILRSFCSAWLYRISIIALPHLLNSTAISEQINFAYMHYYFFTIDSAFHILMVPASFTAINFRPSRLKSTDRILLGLIHRVKTSEADSIFHNLTVPSQLAVAMRRPSRLKAIDDTVRWCPLRFMSSAPASVSQTLTVYLYLPTRAAFHLGKRPRFPPDLGVPGAS